MSKISFMTPVVTAFNPDGSLMCRAIKMFTST